MDLSEPSCILLPGLPGSDGAGYGGAGQGGHGSGQGGHGVELEPGGEEASGTSWRSLPSTPIILIALEWNKMDHFLLAVARHLKTHGFQPKRLISLAASILTQFRTFFIILILLSFFSDILSAVWREAKKEQIYWTWLWCVLVLLFFVFSYIVYPEEDFFQSPPNCFMFCQLTDAFCSIQ